MTGSEFELFEIRKTSRDRYALCVPDLSGHYKERAFSCAPSLLMALEEFHDLMNSWFRPRMVAHVEARTTNGETWLLLSCFEYAPEYIARGEEVSA